MNLEWRVYELHALQELKAWQKKMCRKPSLLNRLSKKMQTKLNSFIPDKVHKAVTVTIKQMVRKRVVWVNLYHQSNRFIFIA